MALRVKARFVCVCAALPSIFHRVSVTCGMAVLSACQGTLGKIATNNVLALCFRCDFTVGTCTLFQICTCTLFQEDAEEAQEEEEEEEVEHNHP